MATTNLGRVVPLHKGAYQADAEYQINHVVTFNGSLYWHYGRTATTGVPPTDGSVWRLCLNLKDAEQFIQCAETAAENAAKNAKNAQAAQTGAENAKTAAETAQTAAGKAKTGAEAAAKEAKAAQTAAETAKTGAEAAQGKAVEAAEGVAADREQIGANTTGLAEAKEELSQTKTELEATQKDLAKAQRAIKLQAKLTQGQVWDFEEDDAEAYRRTVPSGAYAAAVESYGGKTVGWNQLLDNLSSNIKPITGTTYMTDIPPGDVAASTIVRPLTSNGYRFNECIPDTGHLVSGHAYMLSVDIKYTTAAPKVVVRFQYAAIADDTSKELTVTQNWQHLAMIAKMKQSIHSANLYIDTNSALAAGDTIELKNARLVDLTLLYGPGNEPTTTDDPRIAQIEAYTAAHPEYNAGELVSAEVDEVIEAGKNLIDFTPYTTNASGYTMKFFPLPKIRKGKTYVFSVTLANGATVPNGSIVCVFLKGTTQIINKPPAKAFVSTVDHTDVERFYIYNNAKLQGVEIAGVQLEEAPAPTTYSPYHQTTHPIPAAVKALPGYGWSAGSVANTIERTEDGWQYVQRVGKITLDGTENWNADSGQYIFMNNPQIRPERNFICNVYSVYVKVAIENLGVEGFTWSGSSYVEIYTDKTLDEWKAHLAGLAAAGTPVIIYYALLTPVETDITALMSDTDLCMDTEPGGSITLHHSAGEDGLELAGPAKIQYITKLSEVNADG